MDLDRSKSKLLPSWIAKIPDWVCAYCTARKHLKFLPDQRPAAPASFTVTNSTAMTNTFEDEIIEALDFGFDMIEQTKTALEDDNRIKGAEYIGFIKPLTKAPRALEGLSNPIDRWRELPQEQKQKVYTYAKERFDLPDDQVERLIEDTIQEVYGDIVVAKRWGAFVRTRKERRAIRNAA